MWKWSSAWAEETGRLTKMHAGKKNSEELKSRSRVCLVCCKERKLKIFYENEPFFVFVTRISILCSWGGTFWKTASMLSFFAKSFVLEYWTLFNVELSHNIFVDRTPFNFPTCAVFGFCFRHIRVDNFTIQCSIALKYVISKSSLLLGVTQLNDLVFMRLPKQNPMFFLSVTAIPTKSLKGKTKFFSIVLLFCMA